MPASVRKAIRLNLVTLLRGVAAAWKQTEARQRELIQGMIEAHEQRFPAPEIERLRADAVAAGFTPADFDELLHATGWTTT